MWGYLEQKILKLAQQRNMNRSVNLSIVLPPEISTPLANLTESVKSLGLSKQKNLQANLKTWSGGFFDSVEYERQIQSEMISEIRKDNRVGCLAKKLNHLLEEFIKTM